MKLQKVAPYFLVAILVILGFILRIYDLDEKSLFGDEWHSVRDAERGSSPHPIFFFLILRVFMFNGTNDFVLRLPAVIFGVLTVPLCYYIGKLFFGKREGLVSAFLLSVSWIHVFYSQQVRMYSLFVFLSLSSLFFFHKCFFEGEEKRKRRRGIRIRLERNEIGLLFGFIVSTVLGLYTHFLMVFIVAVEIVYFGLMMISYQISERGKSVSKRIWESKRRENMFILFLLCNIAIFALYSPMILTRREEVSWLVEEDGDEHSVPTLELSFFIKTFTWFSNTRDLIWSGNTAVFALSLYLSFFICGLLISVKKSKKQIALLSMWVALQILLTFLLSTRTYIMPKPRYLVSVLPIYLIIISRGIVGTAELVSSLVKERWRARTGMFLVVLSLILIVFSCSSIPALLGYYNRPDDENWRGVAQYLEREWQPNDVILVEPEWNRGPFLYYYHTNPSESVLTPTSLAEIQGICKYERVWHVYPYNYRDVFDSDKEKLYWLYKNSDSVFNPGGIDVFFLSPEEHPLFKAGVFLGSAAEWAVPFWTSTLLSMGASITVFNETTIISNSSLSGFDIIFFIDFGRAPSALERQIIEESVEKGLVVVLIGLSPYYLAGGTYSLTKISSWFGATHLSEAPKEARWKVKFTENATEIMKNIDLDREYIFYTSNDWSTPAGCTVDPQSVVYAYRVNDEAGAIFSHKFGNGTSIFNGAQYGYYSEDAETWSVFLQASVQSVMRARINA